MRLLLDTHAFVWASLGVPQLSATVLRALSDPANTIFVSSATAWELSIKHRSGKFLPESGVILATYDDALARVQLEDCLLVTSDQAITNSQLAQVLW